MTPISSFASETWYYFWLIALMEHGRKHAQGLLVHFYQNSSYSRGQRTKEGFCWFLSIFTQDTTESSWQHVMAISFLVVQVFYSWSKTCTNCPWSLHWELILVKDLEAMNGSGTGSTDSCHPLWGICPRYSHYRRCDVKDGSPGRTWGTCLCHQGRCRGFRGRESSASVCVLDICQHPTSPHLCGVRPFTWLRLCHSHSQVSSLTLGCVSCSYRRWRTSQQPSSFPTVDLLPSTLTALIFSLPLSVRALCSMTH